MKPSNNANEVYYQYTNIYICIDVYTHVFTVYFFESFI